MSNDLRVQGNTIPNTITGKVTRVERMGLSRYGNPYHRVAIEIESIDGTPAESSTPVILRTQIDSGINYAINNPEYRDVVHVFKLTRAGRIYGAELSQPHTCDVAGTNHSDDIVKVWHGSAVPLWRCGFHVQQLGTSPIV